MKKLKSWPKVLYIGDAGDGCFFATEDLKEAASLGESVCVGVYKFYCKGTVFAQPEILLEETGPEM